MTLGPPRGKLTENVFLCDAVLAHRFPQGRGFHRARKRPDGDLNGLREAIEGLHFALAFKLLDYQGLGHWHTGAAVVQHGIHGSGVGNGNTSKSLT